MDDEQVEEIKVEDDSDNDTVPQSCDVRESSEETTSAERNFRVLRPLQEKTVPFQQSFSRILLILSLD